MVWLLNLVSAGYPYVEDSGEEAFGDLVHVELRSADVEPSHEQQSPRDVFCGQTIGSGAVEQQAGESRLLLDEDVQTGDAGEDAQRHIHVASESRAVLFIDPVLHRDAEDERAAERQDGEVDVEVHLLAVEDVVEDRHGRAVDQDADAGQVDPVQDFHERRVLGVHPMEHRARAETEYRCTQVQHYRPDLQRVYEVFESDLVKRRLLSRRKV